VLPLWGGGAVDQRPRGYTHTTRPAPTLRHTGNRLGGPPNLLKTKTPFSFSFGKHSLIQLRNVDAIPPPPSPQTNLNLLRPVSLYQAGPPLSPLCPLSDQPCVPKALARHLTTTLRTLSLIARLEKKGGGDTWQHVEDWRGTHGDTKRLKEKARFATRLRGLHRPMTRSPS
jgi:hypothetical protein